MKLPWFAPLLVLPAALACQGSPVRSVAAIDEADGVVYALPQTLVEIVVVIAEAPEPKDAVGFVVTVSTNTRMVADARHEFTLSRDPSIWASDTVKFTVGAEGLLASFDSTSTDESLSLARGLTDAAIAAVKLGALSSAGAFSFEATGEFQPARLARKQLDEEIERQLRPLVGTHRRLWALPATGPLSQRFDDFPAAGWSVEISLARADAAPARGGPSQAEPQPSTPDEFDGVYVRGVEPFVTTTQLHWNVALPATPSTAAADADLQRELDGELDGARDALDASERAHPPTLVVRLTNELAAQNAIVSAPPSPAAKQAAQAEIARLQSLLTSAQALAGAITPAELQTATKNLVEARAAFVHAQADRNDLAARQATRGQRLQAAWDATATAAGFTRSGGGYGLARTTRSDSTLLVSDFAPITRIPLERAAFVKSTDKLTFTNGVLTGREWDRPSSAAAVAGFPAEVLGKLISLPGEILKLKFDVSSAATKLAKQQEDLRAAREQQAKDRLADEESYYTAYARAKQAEAALAAVPPDDDKALSAARAALFDAQIAANSAARKIGVPVPYSSITPP